NSGGTTTSYANIFNSKNQISTVNGSTSNAPSFDLNGNTTKDENDGVNPVHKYVFDAWNRIVKVLDSTGTTTLATYKYDALGRRIQITEAGVTTDLYYAGGHVVEEPVNGTAPTHYVWGLGYDHDMLQPDQH